MKEKYGDEYEMRDKVLGDMEEDMGKYEYEKKLKPLLTITIAGMEGEPEEGMEEMGEEYDGEMSSLEELIAKKKKEM